MNVSLTPDWEALVRQKVQSGRDSDASDVLREALRPLDERDEQLRRLKGAIASGDAEIARGEAIPWMPGMMDRLKNEAAPNLRSGRPVKDEVRP